MLENVKDSVTKTIVEREFLGYWPGLGIDFEQLRDWLDALFVSKEFSSPKIKIKEILGNTQEESGHLVSLVGKRLETDEEFHARDILYKYNKYIKKKNDLEYVEELAKKYGGKIVFEDK